MNSLDRIIGYFAPEAALRRAGARRALAQYEAAQPSRLRNFYRERASQNELVQRSAIAIRDQTRHATRNHDIARGILRTLVNNSVGPKGIGVEPQPRRADGSIHAEYARDLLEAWRDWCRTPEVTHRMSFSRLCRAAGRAWIRDGEVFAQVIQGSRPDLDHGTRVPLSLELFEADLVPMDYSDEAKRIVQGIERNAWGRPVALHVIKTEAGRISRPLSYSGRTKRIPWDRVLHLANMDNIGQVRGVSEFASVITRLEDIKDYEESERIAAKIAAMLTAYVKKGTSDQYNVEAPSATPRQINFQPGMVIDDLGLGEDIGIIDSKRPNPNLITFRQGQLRAAAGGVGASYSSIAKDYNGTYSAQRQELVEQWINYAVMTDDFVGDWVQPIWELFVDTAHLSRVVPMPSDVAPGTHNDAVYVAQAMPWINPLHEAKAWEALVQAGFASEVEAIRRRGGSPQDVLEQIAAYRKEAAKRDLRFTTMQADGAPASPATATAAGSGAPSRRGGQDAEIDASGTMDIDSDWPGGR